MSGAIGMEAGLFLRAFQLGVILMVIYDILRIFRMVVHHHLAVVSLEDLIYWIFNGFAVFRLLYVENDGVIRGFAMAGLFLGMLLYSLLVSPWIIKVIQNTTNYLKKILKSITISIKKR